jgi:hypothetical protein
LRDESVLREGWSRRRRQGKAKRRQEKQMQMRWKEETT